MERLSLFYLYRQIATLLGVQVPTEPGQDVGDIVDVYHQHRPEDAAAHMRPQYLRPGNRSRMPTAANRNNNARDVTTAAKITSLSSLLQKVYEGI